jgi:hypothetical protein
VGDQLRVSEDWQLPDQGSRIAVQHAVQAHAETENGARDKAIRDFVNALRGRILTKQMG